MIMAMAKITAGQQYGNYTSKNYRYITHGHSDQSMLSRLLSLRILAAFS